MADEYVIKLTPRMRDSLKNKDIQKWLIEAEKSTHPYWTHVMSDVIEQICEQNNVTPIPQYTDERQKIWLQ